MRYTRYCRSVLITPAPAVDRYRKNHQSAADICVVDLEDSVSPGAKETARRQAATFFSLPSARARRCGLRINAVTEPDGLRDLIALLDYDVKPTIVLIPKVEADRDIEIVEQVLGAACRRLELFPIVETPRGVENATAIATASPAVRALVFGAVDYSFAVGARRSWECLQVARARVVNSARAAGAEAIDSPVFEFSDLQALRWEAPLSKDLGFSGKVAIHPGQVPIINAAFSPDRDTLDRARRIVAAGVASDNNVAVVDGVMAGRPFFEAAQLLLDEFGKAAGSVGPAEPVAPDLGKEG